MFLVKASLSVERLFPVEKVWETTKNLGAYPVWLLNSTISKFWHFSYMVIALHNLKILLFLLLLSQPTISTFYQPTNLNFLGLVIPLNHFMPMNHCVIKKASQPHPINCFFMPPASPPDPTSNQKKWIFQ